MEELKATFVWVCKEIIARLEEAEAVGLKELGHLTGLMYEMTDLSERLGLRQPPIAWDETRNDSASNPNVVTIAIGVILGDPTKDRGAARLLYITEQNRSDYMPIARRNYIDARDLSKLRAEIKTTMQRWIRYADRPDFPQSHTHAVAEAANTASQTQASTIHVPPTCTGPKSFDGGNLVFFSDRVELCGVDICSGPRASRRRKILELLRARHGQKPSAYSGAELAAAAGLAEEQIKVAGIIRDIRERITKALLEHANIVCRDEGVILSGGPGYRLADCITVQNGQELQTEPPTDIRDRVDVPNVPDPHVPNVPDEAAQRRRAWILEQLELKNRLQASAVAKRFDCSKKTAKRDLKALKDQGKIEFVGAARTGYYRLRSSPALTQESRS
jgi:HTH domain